MDPQSTCQALLRLECRCTCQARQVMIGVGKRHVWMFWWVPSGTRFCQLRHWQIRDGDSHKVQKVLICFMKSLECIALTLHILPIVLGFVCTPMLVVVVHTGLTWLRVILVTFLLQLCLEETTMNWHVTGDRDIFHSIQIVWSVPRVVPSFSTEETKVTGKKFQFRLILHFSTQQVRSLQTNSQVLWRSLCWLRWCRGALAMWWLEKMSKQPEDRLLYGFNILAWLRRQSPLMSTPTVRGQWERSLGIPLVATRSLFVEPHHNSIDQLEQLRV